MGVTASSGPGIALKAEAIGLAVMTELPLLIINVQRGGPSTGLPTKTEQADLLQAMFGRNGECPMPVIAARSPADCFDVAHEAWRIAIAVHDAGDAADRRLHRQRLRAVADSRRRASCRRSRSSIPGRPRTATTFMPYARDERLARPWAMPGTPGLMHRIGGLEKQDITGNVNYEPANHEHMVNTAGQEGGEHRQRHSAAGSRRPGDAASCWCSAGAAPTAPAPRPSQRVPAQGASVAHAHLRYLNPFPRTWARSSSSYEKVLVPELNLGQLRMLIRAKYLVDADRAEQGPRQAVRRRRSCRARSKQTVEEG